MTNPNNPNNMSELDPEKVAAEGIDPLTDTRTVAQTPTDESDIVPLPENADGTRAGDYDRTTGAAHPSADSDSDSGSAETSREQSEQ